MQNGHATELLLPINQNQEYPKFVQIRKQVSILHMEKYAQFPTFQPNKKDLEKIR